MPPNDLVEWLSRRKLKGTLTMDTDGVRRQFWMDNGMVVRASSSDSREYFGQFLVHAGLMTDQQLARAFETQRETNVLLGRILVMIGTVAEEQVIQALRSKMGETLLDACRKRSGSFTLDCTQAPDDRPEISVAIPLETVLVELERREEMWQQYGSLFPDERRTLQVDPERIGKNAAPETLDGRIIALASHGKAIEDIRRDLRATDYQIAGRLVLLYQTGVLKLYAEPLPPDPANPCSDQAFSKDAIPVLTQEIDNNLTDTMSPKERYVLARIDGKRSVKAIIQVSPMKDFEALAIIGELKKQGLVSL